MCYERPKAAIAVAEMERMPISLMDTDDVGSGRKAESPEVVGAGSVGVVVALVGAGSVGVGVALVGIASVGVGVGGVEEEGSVLLQSPLQS
jgi:hypothetical protein